MDIKKAQSAIEYLFTYGWMLVVVSIVGGLIYSQIGTQCEINVSSGPTGTVTVEQVGATSDDRLLMEIRSNAVRSVEVDTVQISDGDETYFLNKTFEVEPGSSEALEVAESERIDDCRNFDASIIYTEGMLTNQVHSFQIQAPVEIMGEITTLLETGGGQIQALNIQSTVMPESGTVCMGGNCPGTVQETGEYVNRSGDTMIGPLNANTVEHECIGAGCNTETGSLNGFVSNQNNTMDGTLTVTNIKPVDRLCMGSTC